MKLNIYANDANSAYEFVSYIAQNRFDDLLMFGTSAIQGSDMDKWYSTARVFVATVNINIEAVAEISTQDTLKQLQEHIDSIKTRSEKEIAKLEAQIADITEVKNG